MKVAVYTEKLPESFRWTPRTAWRGTEEFYVETARSLAKAGHQVTVFYDGEEVVDTVPGYMVSALYLPRDRFGGGGSAGRAGGFDVVLCCNETLPGGGDSLPGVRKVYWTNLYGDRIERHLWADAHITISNFAAGCYGVVEVDGEITASAHVIGHGVDAGKYANLGKEPIALYSSSMDRGGTWLKALWDRFGVRMPDGRPIKLLCSEGKMSDADLTAAYRTAALWLHPGLGVELFCISALKAKAAGCLCVYSPVMALPETIGPSPYHIKEGAIYWPKKLASLVPERLTGLWLDPTPPIVPSWDDVTGQLIAVLDGSARAPMVGAGDQDDASQAARKGKMP